MDQLILRELHYGDGSGTPYSVVIVFISTRSHGCKNMFYAFMAHDPARLEHNGLGPSSKRDLFGVDEEGKKHRVLGTFVTSYNPPSHAGRGEMDGMVCVGAFPF